MLIPFYLISAGPVTQRNGFDASPLGLGWPALFRAWSPDAPIRLRNVSAEAPSCPARDLHSSICRHGLVLALLTIALFCRGVDWERSVPVADGRLRFSQKADCRWRTTSFNIVRGLEVQLSRRSCATFLAWRLNVADGSAISSAHLWGPSPFFAHHALRCVALRLPASVDKALRNA